MLRVVTVWSMQDAVQVDAPPPRSCGSELRAAAEWTMPQRRRRRLMPL